MGRKKAEDKALLEEDRSLFEFDREYDVKLLCGVDEAGRGPLAGDCVAAAVILPVDCYIEGLNDSKKLTEKKRDKLFDIIIEKALFYKIVNISVETIEEINILNSALLGMKQAVEGLGIIPDRVVVDGNKLPTFENIDKNNTEFVIKGDGKSQSIAAASILAKVTRDRYMLEMDEVYPEYQFKKHKGYGTKLHYSMLDKHGVSPIHRKSFLKKYYEQKSINHSIGRFGEDKTVEYLIKKGYEILFRNYWTNAGELDIIAVKDNLIRIVEVKTRRNFHPRPEVSIGHTKRMNMSKTTDIFFDNEKIDLPSVFAISEVVIEDKKVYINFMDDAFSIKS